MKRHLRICLMAALFFLAVSGSAFAQKVLWVSASDAKLMSGPGAGNSTLAVLDVGAEVELLSTEGRWYEIKTKDGESGWIYRGRVSETAPVAEVSQGDDLFAGLGGSGISSKDASTSRSIRGLSKETEAYAKRRGTSVDQKKALETVLSWSVGEESLEKFLVAGKIGEYAGN